MIPPKNLIEPDVTDVVDVRTMTLRRLFRSKRFLAVTIVAVATLAVAIWWTQSIYLKPARDQRTVDEAVVLLEINPQIKQWLQKASGWPEERRLISLAMLFREKELGVPKDLGLKASRAALDLAIHKGSREARLELGKSLRDGDFGEKNSEAALAQFKTALSEIQSGVSASDQDALYVYALMLKDGLGIDADSKKAWELIKKVALSRDAETMKFLAIRMSLGVQVSPDYELAKALSLKLIDAGDTEAYIWGVRACSKQFSDFSGHREKRKTLIESGNFIASRQLLNESLAQLKQQEQCRLPILQRAADKGNSEAKAELAQYADDERLTANESAAVASANTKSTGPISQSNNYRQQPNPSQLSTATDPEAQSNTGYLGGTKQLAKGGLSTFKLDNTKGGGDAVVRLYRDGKKPAARSMFVKNGETFTAEAVAPGAYRLRYRYIGSEDTFEAQETFTLNETKTETGTRFSRMTVTLYKVANGNMNVKKVDSTDF